jgi:transposase
MGKHHKCPVCNSSRIRVGRVRSLLGYLRVFWGKFPVRCEDCSARFYVRGVGLDSVIYAQCPNCLRQDLSAWNLKYYRATYWMRVQMLLGAHRWRCEVCRCNFVSLRPRKDKYVRPSERSATEAAPDASRTTA